MVETVLQIKKMDKVQKICSISVRGELVAVAANSLYLFSYRNVIR
jgi:hypothetical protein